MVEYISQSETKNLASIGSHQHPGNVVVSTRLISIGTVESEKVVNNSSKTEISSSYHLWQPGISGHMFSNPCIGSQFYNSEKTSGIENLENRLSQNRQSCTSKYNEVLKGHNSRVDRTTEKTCPSELSLVIICQLTR